MSLFGFDEQYAMFDITPVANQFLLEFMPLAKGEHVKVYLYGLMQCHHSQAEMSLEQMSRELHLSEEEIKTAYRYWERKGLVQRISDKPLRFRYVNVNKLIFLDGSAMVDTEYELFAEAIYALFGNDYRLHGKQIVMFYEWVEDLHLPSEAVLSLIKHMIDTRGRKFSVESAEKIALEMAAAGVKTAEEAQAILMCDKKVWQGSFAVIEKLNLGRKPTIPEIEKYRKWFVEWGYTQDAILAACDETTAGAKPSFNYLDKILDRKREQFEKKKITSKHILQAREEQENRSEPLRKLLATMNIIGATVNEGTLSVYDGMRKLFTDDVILLAGRECSVRGGSLLEVQHLLESWKGRGLNTLEDVQGYIQHRAELNKKIQSLYQLWDRENRPMEEDRRLLDKWQREWGFSMEMIIACAAYAKDAGKPMLYLNKLLDRFHQAGVATPEEAAAAQAQWKEKLSAPAEKHPPKGKVVREQQYTQRAYEDSGEVPEWMLARWKEMNGDA